LPQSKLKPEEPTAIQVELVPPKEQPLKSKPVTKPAPDPKTDTSANQAEVKPPQVLRPVFKFGEKDAGSNKPVRGDATRDTKVASETAPEELDKKQDTPEQIASAPETPKPDSVAVTVPAPRPRRPTKTTKTSRLQSNNEGPVATTAMGALPRGVRAGKLCVTELRRRLNNSNPPHWPDLLPTYRLDEGNILQVRKGAFRANKRWYDLKFRCEVDEAATGVVTFGFDVGAAVPRAEWPSRGLPE